MATVPKATAQQEPTLAQELEVLQPEIAKVLPEHVTPERFMRVVMTAIAQSPDLRNADRRTLLTSCVKAAQDGLVPDGREAALVIFNNKVKNANGPDTWIKAVQYMPMVFGILKKVRNSGELKQLTVNVAYEKDEFRYFIDDLGEHVLHHPALIDDRGKFLAAYAVAITKDDGRYVEVMTRGQVEQVREISKAKDTGPWKSWYDEMAKKTVIRRLSKRLPMSTDLDAVIRRDDEFYDVNTPGQRQIAQSGTAAAKAMLSLPTLPVGDAPTAETIDPETGEVTAADEQAAAETPLPEGFDIAAEEKALRGSKDLKALVGKWTAVAKRLKGAAMPLELQAAYDEMRESFEEREALQGEGGQQEL